MHRRSYLQHIADAFRVHPVVALVGPRQSGKTTLARQYGKRQKVTTHFDLENPVDASRFEQPLTTLQGLKGLVVIDEVQHAPDLFKTLRFLVDRPVSAADRPKFLVLGSASWNLLRQTSESLAGRIQFIELTPFSLHEVGVAALQAIWLRGGFPKSFLARTTPLSYSWRKNYLQTYLERDIPSLGFRVTPVALRRFWMMLAHYHGHVFKATEIGRSLGVSDHAVRGYLDILAGTFMVRVLQPWVENIGKRQVRSPKVFFRDSGIYHSLLGISTHQDLLHHPKLGASWEGLVMEEVIRQQKAEPQEVFFWGTHNQAELDLLIVKDGKRLGFEVKYVDAPRLTPSMQIAQKDLKLDQLTVVYPGSDRFSLADGIEAVGISALIR